MGVLSKFSKGVPSSRAVSFSRSARNNCDDVCRQITGSCYALLPEARYKNYGKKLIRHSKTKPHNLIRLAQFEVSKLNKLSWFRFSVSGSVPPRNKLSKSDWFKLAIALREFVQDLLDRDVKIHFPVESMNKAISYRNILKGLPVVVRRTIQSKKGLKTFKDNCAYVVGDVPGKHNIQPSFELANQLRLVGKKVVVCPAIEGVSKQGKSQCGKCSACAEKSVDLIIYPKH